MLDQDAQETLKQIKDLYSKASPAQRRKLDFIARHVMSPGKYIRDMREALIRARRNQDLDEIKDIEEWAISHSNYQHPKYEING